MNDQDREAQAMRDDGQNGDTVAAAPGADLGVNTAIGRRLKAFYDDVAGEPVPDRFLSLLDALDRADEAGRRPGGEQESA